MRDANGMWVITHQAAQLWAKQKALKCAIYGSRMIQRQRVYLEQQSAWVETRKHWRDLKPDCTYTCGKVICKKFTQVIKHAHSPTNLSGFQCEHKLHKHCCGLWVRLPIVTDYSVVSLTFQPLTKLAHV